MCNNKLYEYLEKFGKYAHGKRIPREALCLSREKAEYFYNGYMSGDGRKDREEATSTSAALILGMCIIAQRLGKSVPAVYHTGRDENALYKEENANKEILILSGYLKDQLRGIIVENMFVENCTSQKNLMILERCITSVLKKTNHMLQTEQSSTTAKTSQLQESNLDFKETVQACFSELCTLSDNSKKKINPLTFSLRTLRICLVLMEDGISPDCSLKWSRGGMMQNGRCSTPKISECHKTGKDVLLSDILEGEVPQKYFLSKEQMEK